MQHLLGLDLALGDDLHVLHKALSRRLGLGVLPTNRVILLGLPAAPFAQLQLKELRIVLEDLPFQGANGLHGREHATRAFLQPLHEAEAVRG